MSLALSSKSSGSLGLPSANRLPFHSEVRKIISSFEIVCPKRDRVEKRMKVNRNAMNSRLLIALNDEIIFQILFFARADGVSDCLSSKALLELRKVKTFGCHVFVE